MKKKVFEKIIETDEERRIFGVDRKDCDYNRHLTEAIEWVRAYHEENNLLEAIKQDCKNKQEEHEL